MKKTILLTGSNGLLGQKLVSLLSHEGKYNLIATARGSNRLPENKSYTFASLDITDPKMVLDTIAKYKPEYVIHTAAMTNVDQCETEKEACWQQNVKAIEYLIKSNDIHPFHLTHLSTDFIFDGKSGPYDEYASANPLSYYGESKLAAEQLIIASNMNWAMARTVLVYGIANDMSRSNIILWVKKNLEEGKSIQVVDDQWRSPTLAEDLAQGCYLMVENNAKGIFNISGKDFLTPYEMAIKTAKYFGLDNSLIIRTDSSKFKQTAVRPARTGFIIDKAVAELKYAPHSFDEGIEILSKQMNEMLK